MGMTWKRRYATPILGLGLVASACVNRDGPVLPPLPTGPGGDFASGSADGGGESTALATGDAGAVASQTVLVSFADAGVFPCDLFVQQYCAATLGAAFGCYPVGGAGHCQLSGGVGALGSCLVDSDCNPGLLCELQPGPGSFGFCQPICNLGDATSSICGFGESCRPLNGFQGTNVGRCSAS